MWRRTVTDHMISHLTGLNRKPVDKGMVLHGYGNPKPIPVPRHTRYWISTVLPGPVSHLKHHPRGLDLIMGLADPQLGRQARDCDA